MNEGLGSLSFGTGTIEHIHIYTDHHEASYGKGDVVARGSGCSSDCTAE